MERARPTLSHPFRSVPAQAALTGLIYFLTARASLALVAQPAGLAVVWPPSGLLLAILLLTRRRAWPPIVGAVALAIAGANLSIGNGLLTSAGFALANCAESLVAAALLLAAHPGQLTMARLRHVVLLVGGAVVCSNALTALLGASVPALAFGAPFWATWRIWWVADGLGMLLVGATILSWASPARERYMPPRPAAVVEAGALLATLTVLTLVTFGASPGPLIGPAPYLTFPVLLWAAVRFGPAGGSLASLLLSILVVLLTLAGRGPFTLSGGGSALPVLEAQIFLIVAGVSALILGALTAERRDSQVELERANAALERRVEERTAALVGANVRLSAEIRERERAAERARSLQVVAAALSAARTPREVAAVVAEQGLRALGAAAGSVVVRAADAPGQLEVIGAAGYSADEVSPWVRFPLDTPVPIAEAARSGAAIWIETPAALLARYPALVGTPIHNASFAAVPLVADGQPLGGLGLSFSEPRRFDSDDRLIVATLADLCAQAIERARLYEAAESARETAEAALVLREQFLSIASHELKTPLTVLLGNAQLLRRRLERRAAAEDSERRNLDAVVTQAVRLNRLITMLLDVTRIDAGRLALDRAELDLGALVRRTVDEMRPLAPAHAIEAALPAGGPLVIGDELRLEQVVLNLLQNAIKYSPRGGVVHVALVAEAGRAALTVRDEGIGIPAADQSQLFGRFFRARNTAREQISGMGVGLYVVREIVELHGGAVSVASEEGRGAVFTVTLPLLGA